MLVMNAPPSDHMYAPSLSTTWSFPQLKSISDFLDPLLVRINAFTKSRSPPTMPPLALTPFANPTRGLEKRWLRRMGTTSPPADAPDATTPSAKARRRAK